MPPLSTPVVALDLGTTAIKAGVFVSGAARSVASVPAPPLLGRASSVEGDAEEYLRAAEALLARSLSEASGEPAIGISSQRSSFLLWHRSSGRPATPLVSWMDRRGADWCEAHADLAPEVEAATLLRLSPHYVGPKLAHVFGRSRDLRRRAETGDLLFGTLETYLLWRLTRGEAHETDLTMAARTLLVDPRRREWSDGMLRAFGVPRSILPRIVPTTGGSLRLPGGGTVRATVADQAAAVIGTLGETTDRTLVNLGTGGFVLRPFEGAPSPRPGYLVGALLARAGRPTRFAVEGPVQGIAESWDRYGAGATTLPPADPAPEGFCLPETAGAGAPHWRPSTPFAFSEGAQAAPPEEKRRIVLEGIVFRVREIVEGLVGPGRGDAVVVSGGMTRSLALARALASALGVAVLASSDPEASLAGAAALAADHVRAAPVDVVARPGEAGAYLFDKYPRWKAWARPILSR